MPENKVTADGFKHRVNVVLNRGKKNGYKTDIKKFALGKTVPRHRLFNSKELDMILNKCEDESFQRFVQFAYYTGARRGEINDLKDFMIDDGRLQVSENRREVCKVK